MVYGRYFAVLNIDFVDFISAHDITRNLFVLLRV